MQRTIRIWVSSPPHRSLLNSELSSIFWNKREKELKFSGMMMMMMMEVKKGGIGESGL